MPKLSPQATKRAIELFDTAPPAKRECNLGGCTNHSGHEQCSRADFWEACAEAAEDEEYQAAQESEGA